MRHEALMRHYVLEDLEHGKRPSPGISRAAPAVTLERAFSGPSGLDADKALCRARVVRTQPRACGGCDAIVAAQQAVAEHPATSRPTELRTVPAAPMPPPMHIVATTYFTPGAACLPATHGPQGAGLSSHIRMADGDGAAIHVQPTSAGDAQSVAADQSTCTANGLR